MHITYIYFLYFCIESFGCQSNRFPHLKFIALDAHFLVQSVRFLFVAFGAGVRIGVRFAAVLESIVPKSETE